MNDLVNSFRLFLFTWLAEPNVGRSHCSFVSSKKGLGQGINGPTAEWNRRNTLKLHPEGKPLASGSCGLFRDTGRATGTGEPFFKFPSSEPNYCEDVHSSEMFQLGAG
jgi:hypothetical protein